MNVDVEHSTVTLADRTFPACGLVCPPLAAVNVGMQGGKLTAVKSVTINRPDGPPIVMGDPSSDWSRSLGGQSKVYGQWSVFIPCENGVLVNVEQTTYRGVPALDIILNSWHCYRDVLDNLWVPDYLAIHGNRIAPSGIGNPRLRPPFGAWHWDHAEDEWAVEHIDRVSKLPTEFDTSGPRVRAVPLSELVALAPA